MFARVISGQAPADGFDGVIGVVEEQIPLAEAQPGFRAFYLLTDRDSGNLVTISLWDSPDSVKAIEDRAAQVTSEVEDTSGVRSDPVQTYQVEIARLA